MGVATAAGVKALPKTPGPENYATDGATVHDRADAKGTES